MNMSEFLDKLVVNIEDITALGKEGYVVGVTEIIVKNLNALKVEDRPIHCSDVKRETFHIRDENQWIIDTDKSHVNKFIDRAVHKTKQSLVLWRDAHPNWENINSDHYEEYIKIMQECLGGELGTEYINTQKIISNLANLTAFSSQRGKPTELQKRYMH